MSSADAGQENYERRARVHLTSAGQEQLARARQRTWYAGALPVSTRDFSDRAGQNVRAAASPDAVRTSLAALSIDRNEADELGQAVSGGDVVLITGVPADEQTAVAQALGESLTGNVSLPYAIYAGGTVIRVFDPRHHQLPHGQNAADDALDILRTPQEDESPWMDVRRPVVTLSGGLLTADVYPAFDEDARFYLAPPPLTAFGGLLAVFDADTHTAELGELARLWLVPGRHGEAVLLLRSGERIDVPWRASTLLFASEGSGVAAATGMPTYQINLAPLTDTSLRHMLARRLGALDPTTTLADQLSTALEADGLTTRRAAAIAARFLDDRAAYQGTAEAIAAAIPDAVAFVGRADGAATEARRSGGLRLAS